MVGTVLTFLLFLAAAAGVSAEELTWRLKAASGADVLLVADLPVEAAVPAASSESHWFVVHYGGTAPDKGAIDAAIQKARDSGYRLPPRIGRLLADRAAAGGIDSENAVQAAAYLSLVPPALTYYLVANPKIAALQNQFLSSRLRRTETADEKAGPKVTQVFTGSVIEDMLGFATADQERILERFLRSTPPAPQQWRKAWDSGDVKAAAALMAKVYGFAPGTDFSFLKPRIDEAVGYLADVIGKSDAKRHLVFLDPLLLNCAECLCDALAANGFRFAP